jgi:peroxiredoxin
MSDAHAAVHQTTHLPWGGFAFVGVLFAVGVSYVWWLAFRPGEVVAPEANVAEQAKEYLRGKDVQPLSEPVAGLLAHPETFLVASQAHPFLGQPAPDFDLVDHTDRHWHLKQLLARGPVVLVFYYGYHCNHCVGQLFALHDDVKHFREIGAEIVAISADASDVTRDRFKRYGPFAFPVLSDPGNRVAELYGVFTPAKDGQKENLWHATFVVSRDGRVAWCQWGDEPFTNNRMLLYELARIEGRLPPR